MKRLLPVLLLPVVGLLTSLLAAPAAQAATSDTYAATAHSATNAARAQRGLAPLRESGCLQSYAEAQAQRMATAGALSHQSLGRVMSGCDLDSAGENVAYGFDSGRTLVRAGWMHSAVHRANILGRSFRMEAIAAVRGGDGRWYVAQVFGRRG